MNGFHEIEPQKMAVNPFAKIGTEWMLIAAENEGRANAMTASWGGLGVMWGRNAAFIFVRKSRFTKTLLDGADTFSLTFFGGEKKDMLGYMGRASGRDEDKIAASGLTLCHEDGVPYFAEAETVLLCRKMCRCPVGPETFLDPAIDARYYADRDYHDMYIAEITGAWVK